MSAHEMLDMDQHAAAVDVANSETGDLRHPHPAP
jgi:hypothetical protein